MNRIGVAVLLLTTVSHISGYRILVVLTVVKHLFLHHRQATINTFRVATLIPRPGVSFDQVNS